MRNSLKVRLALLGGILGLLQAVAVLAFSYFTLEKELDVQKRAVLRDKAQQARLLIDEMQDGAAVKANAFRLVELVSGDAELHMGVAGSQSGETYVAFSLEAAESLTRLKTDTWQTNAFLVWRPLQKDVPMLSLSTAGKTKNEQPYEVVLTLNRSEDMRLLRGLLTTAGTAVPFGLALVFASTMVIIAIGLRPLRQFQNAVAGISTKALMTRVTTDGLASELQGLAQEFNAMLERLNDGVTRLSQFSGDLAHEMRTPLATLLGRTQVALSQPRGAEQLLNVLEENVEEVRRLTRLVSDMLFLAQADDAYNVLDLQLIDLRDETNRASEFLEMVAQERGVSISINGSAHVMADRSLVQRAITNLITNAVRYCTAGTEVAVRILAVGHGTSLEVVNQGTPIALEHQEKIFDRFYRIDSSRARHAGGTGLGLAIVRAVMTLHDGTAQASTTPAGEVRFSLFFPTVPQLKRKATPHEVRRVRGEVANG